MMKTNNKNSAVDKELYKHYLIDEVRVLQQEKVELEDRLTCLLDVNEDHRKENGKLREENKSMHLEYLRLIEERAQELQMRRNQT